MTNRWGCYGVTRRPSKPVLKKMRGLTRLIKGNFYIILKIGGDKTCTKTGGKEGECGQFRK